MTNTEKVDCVFIGPIFGGRWVPVSEVSPILTYKSKEGFNRMQFFYNEKKWESNIVKK